MIKSNKDIQIVYMGTSSFAVPIFKSLAKQFTISLVVTTPDKPAGREQKLKPSPIKIAAMKLGLPIAQPDSLKGNDEFLQQLKDINADVFVVAAYGKILPLEIINLPEHGCLNVHGSLLPKYRGAAPMQSSLANGDKDSGISVILMDQGMDTGDILVKATVPIAADDYYDDLSLKLSEKSAALMPDVINDYVNGSLNLEMQDDDEASYAYRISADSGRARWVQSARAIYNRIRALSSTEGSYTMFDGKRLNIYKASVCSEENHAPDAIVGQVVKCPCAKGKFCVRSGKGNLNLDEVQLEGKKRMTIKDFVNGHQDFIGAILK